MQATSLDELTPAEEVDHLRRKVNANMKFDSRALSSSSNQEEKENDDEEQQEQEVVGFD